MSSGQHTCGHALLHGHGQLEQADRVADLRARSADPSSQLLLGDAEVLEQLLVGRGLFEWVQLGAVQVLEQCVAQEIFVGGLADDGGCLLYTSPSPRDS